MSFYGVVFRLLGWAFAIGLITGELTYYDDGHTDGLMVAAGWLMLGYWIVLVWPIIEALLEQTGTGGSQTQSSHSTHRPPAYDSMSTARAPTTVPPKAVRHHRPPTTSRRSLASESAGRWIIRRVEQEAMAYGRPLLPRETRALSQPIGSFSEADREAMMRLNNRVVGLVRSGIERDKSVSRTDIVPVSGHLTLPRPWMNAYDTVYRQELDWAVSGIMQNAILGNPVAGELGPWVSR